MVPRDTPMHFPASSCERPSKSTSLKASSSAGSMYRGSESTHGIGVKTSIVGALPNLTGFGSRPLRPRLHLHLRLIIIAIIL